MNKSSLNYFFTLILLVFFCDIYAQNLVFEKISTKNGLSSNNVLSISKDSQGYLWLATNLGISRYDGYQFQQFGSLSTPKGLTISKKGKLWFSNEKGLWSLNTKSLLLELKIANQLTDDNPDNDHYNEIFVDEKERVWSTDFHHIKCYDAKQNRLTYFQILKKNQQNPSIAKFSVDHEGKLWSVSPMGLCQFDEQKKRWIRFLKDKSFNSLTFNKANSTFWIGNREGELGEFDIKKKIFQVKYKIDEPIEQIQFSRTNDLICISRNHLFRLNVIKNQIEEIDRFIEEGIIFNKIFADSDKNELWVGTNEGLFKQENENQLIKQVQISKEVLDYPAIIRCFESVNEGNYLLGMSSGDILQWNKSTNDFVKIIQLFGCDIKAIKTVNKRLYVASNKGLFEIKKGEKLKKLVSQEVNSIELDEYNRLWILSPNEPIKVLDLSKNTFIELWKKLPYPTFFKENLFHRLCYTQDQKMWIAGWIPSGFGIAYFDLKTNEFKELSSINEHKKFIGDYYLDVSVSPKHELLFSGYGGYNRLNTNGLITEEVHAEDLKPIFADGQCFAIEEDLNENTWIGTAEGLVRITKDKRISRFTQFDGLLNNDIRNGFLMLTNELLIGHKNGFSIFNLKNANLEQYKNQLKLSQIAILGSEKKVNLDQSLVFTRKQNNLSFAFSPLNFENQAKNKYRYRMTGINEKWIENGVNPTVTFSNLEQGNYVLEVQYAEVAGNWNTNTRILKFEILPAWYETIWFKIVLILMIIGVVYALYWYRISEFKKLQLMRNRISSDLHDEIGASLSSIGILGDLIKKKLTENHSGYSFAEMITDEAKQAGTAIDYIIWNVNPQFDSLESLFTRINSEAAELIEAKEIQYEFEAYSLGNRSMSMDKKRNIYLICKELINNALKHSECSKIVLYCQVNFNYLEINFSDNGKGFNVDLETNRNGLKNIQSRTKELKGTCKINSAEGQGTKYEIRIPLR
ncbi:sensor histidine kinase [Emticicia aquatica]|nr:triple tyrosine motif-containing protein [Emticicia aquatica]